MCYQILITGGNLETIHIKGKYIYYSDYVFVIHFMLYDCHSRWCYITENI